MAWVIVADATKTGWDQVTSIPNLPIRSWCPAPPLAPAAARWQSSEFLLLFQLVVDVE